MLRLNRADYDKILAHARGGLPNEACGLIGGNRTGEDAAVEAVYLLTNTDNSPEHFSMDPAEQLQAVQDMRARGIAPLGNFHSHPDTPSRPSREDIRLARDPGARYLILSLADRDNPVLRAFRIAGSGVTEETIDLI